MSFHAERAVVAEKKCIQHIVCSLVLFALKSTKGISWHIGKWPFCFSEQKGSSGQHPAHVFLKKATESSMFNIGLSVITYPLFGSVCEEQLSLVFCSLVIIPSPSWTAADSSSCPPHKELRETAAKAEMENDGSEHLFVLKKKTDYFHLERHDISSEKATMCRLVCVRLALSSKC